MRKLPRALMLWGVPGAGKTTYADYLVREHGYTHIESDASGAGDSRAAKAWRAVLANLDKPEMTALAKEFAKVAQYERQPVVLEYGMGATEGGIGLLKVMVNAGAEAWWFEGDPDAAFAAWKAENTKNPRRRDWPDQLWHDTVGVINANYAGLKELFGDRMVRTIEAGPTHVPVEDTFQTMF